MGDNDSVETRGETVHICDGQLRVGGNVGKRNIAAKDVIDDLVESEHSLLFREHEQRLEAQVIR